MKDEQFQRNSLTHFWAETETQIKFSGISAKVGLKIKPPQFDTVCHLLFAKKFWNWSWNLESGENIIEMDCESLFRSWTTLIVVKQTLKLHTVPLHYALSKSCLYQLVHLLQSSFDQISPSAVGVILLLWADGVRFKRWHNLLNKIYVGIIWISVNMSPSLDNELEGVIYWINVRTIAPQLMHHNYRCTRACILNTQLQIARGCSSLGAFSKQFPETWWGEIRPVLSCQKHAGCQYTFMTGNPPLESVLWSI
jgi:hypothetical protein